MKYILVEIGYQCVAIPAEHGDILGSLKLVKAEWNEKTANYDYRWDDKEKPKLTLVSSSEILQPKEEEESNG